jgi:hypothetical protein
MADAEGLLTSDIANSVDIMLDAYREGFRVIVSVYTRAPVLRLRVTFENNYNSGRFNIEVSETETINQTMRNINVQIRHLLSMAAIRELAVLRTQEEFHVN